MKILQIMCKMGDRASKTTDNISSYNNNKDIICLLFYLSLNKLRLVLSLMNILNELLSFDPMYIMLLFFIALAYIAEIIFSSFV